MCLISTDDVGPGIREFSPSRKQRDLWACWMLSDSVILKNSEFDP